MFREGGSTWRINDIITRVISASASPDVRHIWLLSTVHIAYIIYYLFSLPPSRPTRNNQPLPSTSPNLENITGILFGGSEMM